MKARRLAALCAAVGLASLLSTTYAAAGEHFNLVLIPSFWEAKQFLESVQWDRYEGTHINVAQETAWEDTAFFFDLKGDEWKVEFPNDRFFSRSRQHYGDLAKPREMKGDLKKAALELLEKDQVHVYRIWPKVGQDTTESVIVMSPYTVYAVHDKDTITIRLDEEGLQAREGDEPDFDLGFLSRMGKARRRHKGKGKGKGNNHVTNGNNICTIDAVPSSH